MTSDPIHRAFVEAGYASLGGYMKEHGEVPATADPAPTIETYADDIASLVAEVTRLRTAHSRIVALANELSWSPKTRELSNRIRAALGETHDHP